jgi:uracil-DNA glycosylase
MNFELPISWNKLLAEEFQKPYFIELNQLISNAYGNAIIYPPHHRLFSAFENCFFENTEVVILGQDPYHGPNQANGLSFSVNDGVPIPPSLLNIFKEIKNDLGKPIPTSGNLERWSKQGVLLLNATLSVKANAAGSHQNIGWEQFTDAVIQLISERKPHVVFMLWGNYAQKKATFIDENKHLILRSVHPSPLSAYRGFLGCKHFSQCNTFLKANGLKEIDW